MTIEIGDGARVHEAHVLGRAGFGAAGLERSGGNGIDIHAAVTREGVEGLRLALGSGMGLGEKLKNFSWVSAMTKIVSEMTRQAAVSSVKAGL